MQERHITTPGPVLDEHGVITPGYSERSICTYRRADIKAPFYRIKEWDFYQVSDGEKCLQFTYGHASYAGQVAVMLFNFKTGEVIANISKLLALPFGSLHLPENAEQDSDICYDKGGVHLRFKVEGDTRYLSFSAPDFEANITLERKNPYSLVIHIPFDEYKTAFYYNHKINCMTARGRAVCGGKEYIFGDGAFGLLDWGRGVWTRDNTWYWAVAQGWQDGRRFGLNLGYGFGDTSAASENMVFIDGAAHKLHRVDFGIPQKTGGAHAKKTADRYQLMQPWHMTDDEGRLDLVFTPLLDRVDWMDFKLIRSDQHQVFGRFDGTVVLDDGSTLPVENLLGSAEVIHNVY